MSRWPLRLQIPIIALSLLLVAQLIIGVAALALVQRSLVSQIDKRLGDAAGAIAERPGAGVGQGPRVRATDLPSDYVVLYYDARGTFLSRVSSAVSGGDAPDLSIDSTATAPYTAREVGSVARWRLVTHPLPGGRGTVTVALPLTEATAATASLRRTLLLVFLATGAAGGLVAWWATHHSLRALRHAEATASAIAAGDWSKRVPSAPDGTEVGSLARSLNAMLDRLDAAFAAQRASEERLRTFLADASHELRTPLAAIRGYAELQQTRGAMDSADAAGRIEANAVRMGALIEDLLALARFDEAPAAMGGTEAVDLATLVEEAAADARAQAPDRVITVAVPAGPHPIARGSALHLRQLLANICGNALRHTPPGTPIELALALDGAEAAITVRDHGPGIPPGDETRIFERFYRPDSSRARQSGGSGLGLAIVAAIVSAHRGSVTATSANGGGATIVVRLPLEPLA